MKLPHHRSAVMASRSLLLAVLILLAASATLAQKKNKNQPPPPDPNWGSMLAEARQFMELAPLTVIGPAAAIVFASLTFIIMANGLREVLDVGGR